MNIHKCGHCGGVNEWEDDCGFFYYNNEEGEYLPACEACWTERGIHGDR